MTTKEIKRDELCEMAEEAEAISSFLANIGDYKKAMKRLLEAQKLRKQIKQLDATKRNDNEALP